MGGARRGWWCALAAAFGALVAHAQPDPNAARPGAAGRVVTRFDFETPETPLPVPPGWVRGQSDPAQGVERPGFPVWNGAELDRDTPAFSGKASVRLPVDGGSGSLVLRAGMVTVFPLADYRVLTAVRTSPGMRVARARVVARLLDQNGARIDGAEYASGDVLTRGAWRGVSVDVLGVHPDAAFLQLELQVLQPRERHRGPVRPFTVWEEDHQAAAWFDDIVVLQSPRIDIETSTPGGFVRAPDRPELVALVRDLAGDDLRVDLLVLDMDGRPVASFRRPVSGGRLDVRWTPDLPAYGWYRARLTVAASGMPVGAEWCDFLWMPEPGPTTREDLPRFSASAGDLTDTARALVPALLATANIGSVTVPVWTGAPLDRHDPDALNDALNDLLARGIEPTLALERVPEDLAHRASVDPRAPATLLSSDRSQWGPALDPLLDRFGQRCRRWQIGRRGDGLPGTPGTLDRTLDTIADALAALVPAPTLAVPWSSDRAIPGAMTEPGRLAVVSLGPGTDEAGLRVLAEDWKHAAARAPDPRDDAELTLVLEPPDDATYGRRQSTAALARQVAAFWAMLGPTDADPGSDERAPDARVELGTPWTVRGRHGTRLEPTPALGAMSTLAEHLAGRFVVDDLDAGPGVRALLLAPHAGVSPDRGGALVAWRDSGASSDTSLRIFLGEGEPVVHDLFGNESPVRRLSVGEAGIPMHEVPLGPEPVIVEGVDASFMRFVSGLRLVPKLVISRPGPHPHELLISNPWPFPVRGRLFIVEPGGYGGGGGAPDRSWEIEPRVIDFSIQPGEVSKTPITISFSSAERAGEHELVADIELGWSRTGLVRARKSFELGLDGIRMEVYAHTQPSLDPDAPPGARDVVVQAEVTNLTGDSIAVDLVAVCPGVARGRASIPAVEPGRVAVRRIPFFAQADRLARREIIVGLTMPGREGRLNRAVEVPGGEE